MHYIDNKETKTLSSIGSNVFIYIIPSLQMRKTVKPSFLRLQRNGGKFPIILGDQEGLFNARVFHISVTLSWLIQPPH